MRYLAVILISYCLCSCMATRRQPIQVNIEREIQAVVDSVTHNDTIPTVVVNNINVIMPEQEKPGMSEENKRSIINGFFDAIATIFALFLVDQNNSTP